MGRPGQWVRAALAFDLADVALPAAGTCPDGWFCDGRQGISLQPFDNALENCVKSSVPAAWSAQGGTINARQ